MFRDFRELLEAGWNHSVLCVGLDPDLKKIPQHFQAGWAGWAGNPEPPVAYAYCARIVDVTSHLKPLAYKPNLGFFLRLGSEGISYLNRLIEYIKRQSPNSVIINDCKDGDIGDSMANYVVAALDTLGADAMTANPYLGPDTFQQLLDRPNKGGDLPVQDLKQGVCLSTGSDGPAERGRASKVWGTGWSAAHQPGMDPALPVCRALG